jgi:hypothetical protein
MTKIEKEFCIELIDSCLDLFINGVDVTCAMRPYYATLKLAVRTGWEGWHYLYWTEKQKFARALAIKFGMHNLKATEPEGITNEVSTG